MTDEQKPTPEYVSRASEFHPEADDDPRVGIPTSNGILILNPEDSRAIEAEFNSVLHSEELSLADWADIIFSLETVKPTLTGPVAARFDDLATRLGTVTKDLAEPIVTRYVEKYADTSAAAELIEEFLDREV